MNTNLNASIPSQLSRSQAQLYNSSMPSCQSEPDVANHDDSSCRTNTGGMTANASCDIQNSTHDTGTDSFNLLDPRNLDNNDTKSIRSICSNQATQFGGTFKNDTNSPRHTSRSLSDKSRSKFHPHTQESQGSTMYQCSQQNLQSNVSFDHDIPRNPQHAAVRRSLEKLCSIKFNDTLHQLNMISHDVPLTDLQISSDSIIENFAHTLHIPIDDAQITLCAARVVNSTDTHARIPRLIALLATACCTESYRNCLSQTVSMCYGMNEQFSPERLEMLMYTVFNALLLVAQRRKLHTRELEVVSRLAKTSISSALQVSDINFPMARDEVKALLMKQEWLDGVHCHARKAEVHPLFADGTKLNDQQPSMCEIPERILINSRYKDSSLQTDSSPSPFPSPPTISRQTQVCDIACQGDGIDCHALQPYRERWAFCGAAETPVNWWSPICSENILEAE